MRGNVKYTNFNKPHLKAASLTLLDHRLLPSLSNSCPNADNREL